MSSGRNVALLTALAALALWQGIACAQPVRIAGGAAPMENIFEKIKPPFEKASGLTLQLTANGPVEALKDLDKGTIDAAVGGVTFPDWMAMMDKAGYQGSDRAAYRYRVIGNDVIKVVTHKAVEIHQLSKEQLLGIFSGRTKNWKEVGGPDLAIVVVLGTKIPGTMTVFQKQAMSNAPFAKDAQMVGTADDIKAKVIATRGAVGLVPRASVDATVGAPAVPEIGRPITFITKGEPSPMVAKMLDFIRLEGKTYIR